MKATYLLIAAGLALGCIVPVQSAINAHLGQSLKHPLQASFISFIVGTITLAIVLTVLKIGFPMPKQFSNLSWYYFTGGILGSVFVSSIIFLVPKTGTFSVLSAIVAGELVFAMIADHYGWFGLQPKLIETKRVVGCVLLITGVILVS